MTLVLSYHTPQQVHVFLEQMRHVDLVRLVTGECRPQLHHAALDVVFQFLSEGKKFLLTIKRIELNLRRTCTF